ncbi:hypothetical protein [Chthoniobacter flavus]|uniref:hypothetical protein n=1 Tax=Chthoniobacter flavus TaxID=191863 RepID=UPI0005B26A69|nr:hypothetical protein [Chthoniobacter flavus]
MKRFTSILGTIPTSPIWLRVCIALPFVAVAAMLLTTAGQSHVLAVRPAVSAPAAPCASKTPESPLTGSGADAAKPKDEPIVHGSLSGNPYHVDDPERISAQ